MERGNDGTIKYSGVTEKNVYLPKYSDVLENIGKFNANKFCGAINNRQSY